MYDFKEIRKINMFMELFIYLLFGTVAVRK